MTRRGASLASPPKGVALEVFLITTTALPIELVLAVVLFSAAPGSVTFCVARMTQVAGIDASQRTLHALVTAALVAVNLVLFGIPGLTGIFAGITAGAAAGALYYVIERSRLARRYRTALEITRRSDWTNGSTGSARVGATAALTTIAVAEEMLFRWYVVYTLPACGVGSILGMVLAGTVAYAALHHEEGLDVMLSRGSAGLVLTLVVLGTGSIVFPVAAHVSYNLFVLAKPVQYVRLKEVHLS